MLNPDLKTFLQSMCARCIDDKAIILFLEELGNDVCIQVPIFVFQNFNLWFQNTRRFLNSESLSSQGMNLETWQAYRFLSF